MDFFFVDDSIVSYADRPCAACLEIGVYRTGKRKCSESEMLVCGNCFYRHIHSQSPPVRKVVSSVYSKLSELYKRRLSRLPADVSSKTVYKKLPSPYLPLVKSPSITGKELTYDRLPADISSKTVYKKLPPPYLPLVKSPSITEKELTYDRMEILRPTDISSVQFSKTNDNSPSMNSDIKLSLQSAVEILKPENVSMILIMPTALVFVDVLAKELRLFEYNTCRVSSSNARITNTLGITRVTDDTFVTCGDSKMLWWTLRANAIENNSQEYNFDYIPHCVDFNGDAYYVLHLVEKRITVLDGKGRKAREIVIRRRDIQMGNNIYCDSEKQHIYVGCRYPKGVLCMSDEGEILWLCDLRWQPLGITRIYGEIAVAVHDGVMTLTKEGNKKSHFLKADYILGIDASNDKLAIAFKHAQSIKIAVFKSDVNTEE